MQDHCGDCSTAAESILASLSCLLQLQLPAAPSQLRVLRPLLVTSQESSWAIPIRCPLKASYQSIGDVAVPIQTSTKVGTQQHGRHD